MKPVTVDNASIITTGSSSGPVCVCARARVVRHARTRMASDFCVPIHAAWTCLFHTHNTESQRHRDTDAQIPRQERRRRATRNRSIGAAEPTHASANLTTRDTTYMRV